MKTLKALGNVVSGLFGAIGAVVDDVQSGVQVVTRKTEEFTEQAKAKYEAEKAIRDRIKTAMAAETAKVEAELAAAHAVEAQLKANQLNGTTSSSGK